MKTSEKILFWLPRIFSIALIVFLSMFSLDVFDMDLSAGETALALLVHNIPSIILTILLIIAWRVELVGAFAFLGSGLLYIGVMITTVFHNNHPWHTALLWSMMIAGPALLTGLLFLINWIRKTGKRKNTENAAKTE